VPYFKKKEESMATIPVNLKDIPALEPLPKGEYVVTIVEHDERTSSKGNVGDRWTCEVREQGQYHGRRIWDTTYRTPESLWRLKRLCEAVGYKPSAEVDDAKLIGKVLKLSVNRVEREGHVFNEILSYKRATPEEIQAAESDVPF
jgi:hypothetical protein